MFFVIRQLKNSDKPFARELLKTNPRPKHQTKSKPENDLTPRGVSLAITPTTMRISGLCALLQEACGFVPWLRVAGMIWDLPIGRAST